ncbi:hypothetical protein HYPSUDRAFT_135279 [Hypholoma sublateritium FD-334 SS-4]|uniref:HIT domain-containing protein n=1 Tax=Hypholoma sublateritium (strain FD-334 SS-4) TaxID=945553 RepID=A0A0D2P252_HYPSF|nr:hypothetical protein HYPSUDRAFT_135279 [Hypholoma sublateritium FD-334 SS-4]
MVAITSALLACFKQPFQNGAINDSGSQTSSSCKFCHASVENGFNVVYEDELFLAFQDRRPAAQHHYLVIPRKHIESVKDLTQSDDVAVKRMNEVGHTVLDNLGVPDNMRKTGFHIPPFNSVYHLHLHVHGLPYVSRNRAAKYPVAPGANGNSKGLSWFVETRQAIQILERGKRVGLLPC